MAKGNPTDAGHLTAAKSIFGYSRNYASLEQIQGTGTDPRSDLYSLAATLFHMLTGKPPEDALTRAMTVLSKKADPLVPASTVNPDVPRGVAGVLQKALDLDANERPATASEMREMLHSSDDYAYLADAVTVVSSVTDPRVFAEPTKLMANRTHAADWPATGVATEVIGQTSAGLSLLTSVRSGSSNETAGVMDGNVPNRHRKALFAGALSVLLVGCAVAGAIYVADPSVFMEPQAQVSEPAANPETVTSGPTDASTSSIELDAPSDTVTEAPAVIPESVAQRPQAEKQSETARSGKTSSGDKSKPKGEQGEVLDIHVDDPEVPAEGLVIAEKNENGTIDMIRINPKDPRKTNAQQFQMRGFNPFPPGFDFRTLTPVQKRRLQQLYREKMRTQVRPVPPAQPQVKPTP